MQQTVFTCLGRRISLWTADDYIGRAIRSLGGFYEADVLARCREAWWPGTAIVDVGANIGNHTVFFAGVLDADVIAVEPAADNADLAETNIEANRLGGRVALHRCALGRDDGAATLFRPDPGNPGTTRAQADPNGAVAVRTLDGLVGPLRVGLIKIDVEGAEAAVLAGARGTIARDRPDIVAEAGTPEAFATLLRALAPFGYAPRGCYAATPTYLFSAQDQSARAAAILPSLPG